MLNTYCVLDTLFLFSHFKRISPSLSLKKNFLYVTVVPDHTSILFFLRATLIYAPTQTNVSASTALSARKNEFKMLV